MRMAQTFFKSGIGEKLRNLILPQPSFEEQYCRLCLSPCNSQLKQLFSPFNPTQSIAEVIQDFAKVTFLQEDEYSKVICFLCFVKLKESEDFKLLIENSDFKLRNAEIKYENSPETADNDVVEEKFEVDEIDLKNELISSELGQKEVLKSVNTIETVKNTNNNNNKDPLDVNRRRFRKSYKLKCPECDKIFSWHGNLSRHMITHTGIYPFHCSFCKKGCVSKHCKQKHETIHTGERNYQCEICGKSFKSNFSLSLHRKSHEGVKRHKCSQCDKAFMSNQNLRAHLLIRHPLNTDGSRFSCTLCKKEYTTKLQLKSHMRSVHNPLKFGTCNICNKTVPRLTDHIKIHLKLYKCTVCNRSFGTLSNLKSHSVVHTRQKLYECEICKRTFGFRGSLHLHMRIHRKNENFKCEFCNKQFNSALEWKLHLRKKHQHVVS